MEIKIKALDNVKNIRCFFFANTPGLKNSVLICPEDTGGRTRQNIFPHSREGVGGGSRAVSKIADNTFRLS